MKFTGGYLIMTLWSDLKKNRDSRLLGHVNFDGQNHRFVQEDDLCEAFYHELSGKSWKEIHG